MAALISHNQQTMTRPEQREKHKARGRDRDRDRASQTDRNTDTCKTSWKADTSPSPIHTKNRPPQPFKQNTSPTSAVQLLQCRSTSCCFYRTLSFVMSTNGQIRLYTDNVQVQNCNKKINQLPM